MTTRPPEPAGALLRIAVEAAQTAGRILTAPRAEAVRSSAKANRHDMVTETDLQAEQAIVEVILSRHPDSTVIGEEGGSYGSGRVRWHVDPIDGTNNFACGLPLFCVSIAAELDGRLVAACVHDPVRDETFTAADGSSGNLGGRVRERAATDGITVVVTDFPRGGSDPTERQLRLWARLVRECDVRRIGSSALALAYVASGRAQVACNLGTRAWDVAAGSALVQAAGGRYQALGVGENATLAERLDAPGFIAYGRDVADHAWLAGELEVAALSLLPPTSEVPR